jgi:alpha-galactosidase
MRDRKLPYDSIRKAVREWKGYADLYLGDFYPLTPDRLDLDVWIAWQYDKPAEGRGMVQAFRRPGSGYEAARFVLRGLDPAARYGVTDLDHPAPQPVFTGKDLMDSGLEVTIADKPGTAILLYNRLK